MPVPTSSLRISPVPASVKGKGKARAADAVRRQASEPAPAHTPTDPPADHTSHHRLSFPGVADLFVRLKKHRHASSPSSPEGSPTKSHHILSDSGPCAVSHPQVVEESVLPSPPGSPVSPTIGGSPRKRRRLASTGSATYRRVPLDDVSLEKNDTFICTGAVNSKVLLCAMRRELRSQAEALGANALANERWSCTICGPKHRKDAETFRVQVQYSASPVRTKAVDPGQPVCLENAKGVPGLMSIKKRSSV